jgi:hypothetical protein
MAPALSPKLTRWPQRLSSGLTPANQTLRRHPWPLLVDRKLSHNEIAMVTCSAFSMILFLAYNVTTKRLGYTAMLAAEHGSPLV